MNDLKNKSISDYLKAQYVLIPLHGKVPLAEWRQSKYDSAFSVNGSNFGVALQKDDLVIDIDVKHNAPGLDSFKRLTADAGLDVGWEKGTFVVKTGTGGFHIYLKKPADHLVIYKSKDYPGIEIMSWGRFIVGAGSIHPDTATQYQAVICSPSNVSPAPVSLLNLLKRTKTEIETPQTQDYIDNSTGNQALYIDLLAAMPEVQSGGRANSMYLAACRGRDLGLTSDITIDLLEKHYNPIKLSPSLDHEETVHQVKSAYKYAKTHVGNANPAAIFSTIEVTPKEPNDTLKYDTSKNNVITKSLNNCVNYIVTLLPEAFRLNVFTGNIEVSSTVPWYAQRGLAMPMVSDSDATLLRYFLAMQTKLEFARETIDEAIVVVASRRHYHPVKNYLKSLVWDNIKRLDTWLVDYVGAPNTIYSRDVGVKTLCAAVRRIMEPGCKFDTVLILEGAQGIGKSTICRVLGRLWAGDLNLDPHNKDSVAALKGKWIVELSEMTALKWADANALKSFLSRQTDTVRPAYARHALDFPRQSIFIGTVNPNHLGYLNDATGNRRYWIIPTHGHLKYIELEGICDQLWAEAYQRYTKEGLYLTGQSEDIQRVEALARMPDDPMKRSIYDWMQENPLRTEVNVNEILQYLGIPFRQANNHDLARICKALVDYSWYKVSRPDMPGMVFKKPEKTTEQIINEL